MSVDEKHQPVFPEFDPDDVSSNNSGNRHFRAVLAARASRRNLLIGGTVVAAAGFLGAGTGAALASAGRGDGGDGGQGHDGRRRALLGFTAVPTGTADDFVVPEGYTAQVLIPWGTPLRAGGPTWQKDASNTAAEQAEQVGMHHDGLHFFPIGHRPGASHRGLLVVNHEYIDTVLLYTDGSTTMTQEKVDKALAGHGVTVIQVEFRGGHWRNVDSRYNRRVHGNTPVNFSGPVGPDHPALQANGPARGTLNNCSSGFTPWGTYVTCEENWNGYFGTTNPTWVPSATDQRYGIAAGGGGYRWHTVDPRFDIAMNPNELNRFGWMVEIDPFDPEATPVKRTALGRFKHEGATFGESRGRVVCYSGDDQDGDYIYKFVGDRPWREHIARGRSPLDHGTLHVARFDDDGTGTWLPLVHGSGPLTVANGWADQADVVLRTRLAANAVGATKMDRPEWIAIHPANHDVYCTLTNGTSGPSEVNPRDPNPYGHIIRWAERRGDHTATTFEWDIFLLAGDPAFDPQVELDGGSIFGSPDGIGFDDDGRLWIETDISNGSQNRASYVNIGNNQALAADPHTGEVRRFLVGPRGAEITGFTLTPDQRSLFVNVQHPGESTTAWGGAPTPANPRLVSNWPDFDPAGRPRSATVVIRKRDGGIVGT